MTKSDTKVQEYLERAVSILENKPRRLKLWDVCDAIEIAKLIQLEEHTKEE